MKVTSSSCNPAIQGSTATDTGLVRREATGRQRLRTISQAAARGNIYHGVNFNALAIDELPGMRRKPRFVRIVAALGGYTTVLDRQALHQYVLTLAGASCRATRL